MRHTSHCDRTISTCIHVYMIQLHVWSATRVVGYMWSTTCGGLHVWSTTRVVGYMWSTTCGRLHVVGYMSGRLHVWLWSPPHLACMDEELGDVDGTEWTR